MVVVETRIAAWNKRSLQLRVVVEEKDGYDEEEEECREERRLSSGMLWAAAPKNCTL
jgi:hypothetical protein